MQFTTGGTPFVDVPKHMGLMGLPDHLVEIGDKVVRGADLRREDFAKLIRAFHGHTMLHAGNGDEEIRRWYLACNNVAKVIGDSGEWFNFGRLEQEFLQKNAYSGIVNTYKAGLRAPYPACIFYHKTNVSELLPDIHSFYVVTDTQPATRNPNYGGISGDGDMFPNGSFCIIEYRCEVLAGKKLGFMMRIGVETDYEPYFFPHTNRLMGYRYVVLADPLGLAKSGKTSEVNSCCDPVAIMLTVLNTKGVPVTRVEPPPKVNKARARARRPLLLPYTVVDTSKYYEAAEKVERERKEALGDHRSSPIGHDRRGHPRRLRNGQTIWIRPMAVNGGPGSGPRGPNGPRDEYRIK